MNETISVENLRVHELNQHYYEQVDVEWLVGAISVTKRITPLLVSKRQNGDMVVLGGLKRLKAAVELGFNEVSCEVLENLSDDREMAMIFMDNCANKNRI